MYAGHLSKYILTYNRFVGGYHNARIRFDHTTHIIQPALIDIGYGIEMIFQDGLYTRQRSISGTFTQTVDSSMEPFYPTQHGSKHITYSQIIIIVCVKVEMCVRITLFHLPHKLNHLKRVQDTQCVGKHKPFDSGLLQCMHNPEHVFGRVLHTITPILQIYINLNIEFIGIIHYGKNVFDMFFGRFLQLAGTMFQRTFAQQINDTTSGSMNPIQ